MKNLFLALALTGFVGAASINSVSAFAHAKVITGGGEECKKGKKCKKNDACCKTKTAPNADNKCTKETKKCCSHGGSTGTTTAKPAEVKPDPNAAPAVK